jgi:hypothetical protein
MIITFLLTESIGDAFLSLYNMSLRPQVGLKPDLVLTLAETALHCPSSLHIICQVTCSKSRILIYYRGFRYETLYSRVIFGP